ncbi:hypothetical protein [Ferrimonas aestuarii]|uniref:Type IV pilus biogenesis n=1 Tax=Ferrimonas aestuarii TaxID=2569539 RepID=A0A4V5NW96_9GAMM|nr:hypothetical protein [Ferrimonas aestuarii]TKB56096.1 hypothetical protein FCL42_07725 [Ferrimonas aestuarii]
MNKTATLCFALFSPLALAAQNCSDISDQRQRLACFDKAATAMANCQKFEDKLDRLLCFDELAGKQPQAVAVVAPVSKPAPTPAAQTASAEDRFGMPKVEAEDEAQSLSATVSKVKFDAYDRFIITLDNGQVWKQAESRRYKIKPDYKVTIEKAALGSFLLIAEGRGGSTRVKRVQ